MTWASWQHTQFTRRQVGARRGVRERMHVASLHKLSVCMCRVRAGVSWSHTPVACRARGHALADGTLCARHLCASAVIC